MRASAIIGRAGGAARTYAEFQAHVAALATDGVLSDGIISNNSPNRKNSYSFPSAPQSSIGQGSSWNSFFGFSYIAIVLAHGLPSEAEYLAQIANNRTLFIETTGGLGVGVTGTTRNGFTTSSSGSATRARVDQIIYWDGTQAQRMTPFNGGGPTPYSWT